MIVTGGYRKKGPQIITYRNYTNFCAEGLRKDLCDQITSELQDIEDYGAFDAVVTNTLNKHGPLKKNICMQMVPLMTKFLRKVMMHHNKLHNRYNKSRTEGNLKAFKMERNF